MMNQHSRPPEPEGAVAHRLGPLEFDRADLVYYAACSCGHRIGPLDAVASLQAAFDRHRTVAERSLDPPGA